MSLDIALILEGAKPKGGSGIFVREAGQIKEITREEWDAKFPGREPVVAMPAESDEVFAANITHNLCDMASQAGIYKYLWRPEDVGVTKARELVQPLLAGLAELESKPEFFKTLNPKNGWGNYEALVKFVREYLEACREYPDATVWVSR